MASAASPKVRRTVATTNPWVSLRNHRQVETLLRRAIDGDAVTRVGMGYSQHSGVVIVADGTDDAARRLERVLWNDPATGVMRHADAGYEIAIDCAKEQGLDLPMVR